VGNQQALTAENNPAAVRFCCLPPTSSMLPPLLRHTLLFVHPCYWLISLSQPGQPASLCCFCCFWVSEVCTQTVCPCTPQEGLGWEAWTLSLSNGSDGLHTGIGHLSMVEGCGLVWAWGPDLEGFLPLHACLSMISLSGSVTYIAASGKPEGSGWCYNKTRPEPNQSQQDQSRPEK
jgi:hypothetical protein